MGRWGRGFSGRSAETGKTNIIIGGGVMVATGAGVAAVECARVVEMETETETEERRCDAADAADVAVAADKERGRDVCAPR